MKRILSTFAACMLLACSVVATNLPLDSVLPLSWSTADEDGGQTRTIHCTAWAFTYPSGQQVWITAGHCVRGADGEPALDRDYQIGGVTAQLLADNFELDLAELVGPVAKGLKVGKHALTYGDAIRVAGFPLGWEPVFLVQGTVINPEFMFPGDPLPYVLFDSVVGGGMSGGPVFNKKGEVVSVQQVGIHRLEPFAPVSGGCTLAALRFYLQLK